MFALVHQECVDDLTESRRCIFKRVSKFKWDVLDEFHGSDLIDEIDERKNGHIGPATSFNTTIFVPDRRMVCRAIKTWNDHTKTKMLKDINLSESPRRKKSRDAAHS